MYRTYGLMLMGACFVLGVSLIRPVFCDQDVSKKPAVTIAAASSTESRAKDVKPIPVTSSPGMQVAQLTPASPSALSAADKIGLAFEYAWNEDAAMERFWLKSAASMPPSLDTARATILLAEAILFTSDRTTATNLLDRVRAQSTDEEIIAFADLISGLIPMTPQVATHGRRCYADFEVMRSLCADAAEKWKGTFLGGWASIRLATVLRLKLNKLDEGVTVLEQTAEDYAGTPFREYALEDLAATVTFGLGDFGEGRERYEELLATTTNDFIKQRTTLHCGELLMDTRKNDEANEYFTSFIEKWPAHATTVGAYALRAFVRAEMSLWEEALSDANAYLAAAANGSACLDYIGKAHLVRAEVARARGDLDQAEGEFLLVDDPFLIPSAKAGIGYCRIKQGDLRGAIPYYIDAANSLVGDRSCAPFYLYQVGLLAQRLGDRAAFTKALDAMIAEFPRHDLTSRLAGREVMPVPEI